MLKIVDGFVEGELKNEVYNHREVLKGFHCKWDNETKKWKAPVGCHLVGLEKHLIEYNKQQKTQVDDKNIIWSQACKNRGVQFAKKGTPEYELVKTEFKRLMCGDYIINCGCGINAFRSDFAEHLKSNEHKSFHINPERDEDNPLDYNLPHPKPTLKIIKEQPDEEKSEESDAGMF
jgi:hypothetical protein